MHQMFLCKCGWLLFNPSTLPCGHTMCKHCADENLCCVYCGHTTDDVSSPNSFLVSLLSTWFPAEYQGSRHKLNAKILLESGDYELALSEINTCISMVDNDYSAFQLRALIYLKFENYKDALVDANRSFELNSKCGKSQFVRGSCFSHLGKLDEAIDAFQLCLELEPDNMALCSLVADKLESLLFLPDTDDSNLSNYNSSSDEGIACKKQKLNPSHENTAGVEEKIHGVPKRLLSESDFQCQLCYEFLFKPVTTTCGHVFTGLNT